ncbi:MAG: hypothetical protein LBJ36_11750 [Synergistaceae bacterium]|jgi:flagellin-like hook-associated protein FlgL|nr:hypothetical protein [Synergistaceae bacterium]
MINQVGLGASQWLPMGGLGGGGTSLTDRLSGALKRASDSFQKSLPAGGENVSGDDAVSWQEKLRGVGADPKLKSIDKHITIAEELLTRMKEITESAQSETLSAQDRIALQTELGKLQYELDIQTEKFVHGNVLFPERSYEDTSSYKMLARAAKRVANGERWDVAEVNLADPGVVGAPDKWEITGDPNVPTVGDILKNEGRSVMDSKAAEASTAALENDLSRLQEQQGKLASFVNRNGAANPQGTYSEEANNNTFAKMVGSLSSGTQRLLESFARDPVGHTISSGSISESEFMSQTSQMSEEELKKYDITQETGSTEDEGLWGALMNSRAQNGYLLSVSVNVRIAGMEPTTKMVLRAAPGQDPNNACPQAIPTMITKDDPEFYRQTPRVNQMIDENGKLLVKYVNIKVTLPNPSSFGNSNYYSGTSISIFA